MGDGLGGGNGRAERTAAFAAELRALRVSAGNPSFRRMAQLSGCVSHTTLHEAATGARFPSWETTREFVRACGADAESWRERWVLASTEPAAVVVAVAGEPVVRPPLWRRGWVLTAAVVLVVVLTAGGLALGMRHPSADVSTTLARTSPAVVNPSEVGDSSAFIADVTIPDGTVVRAGQTFQKVWEIQNTGTVTWSDRYLERMDVPEEQGTCRSPAKVPIGATLPGQKVWISVNVVAKDTPGTCWIGWKMADSSGKLLLPNYRPVYLLVTVVAR